ncbi:MAG: GIY-YIG nuclease family protein [Magnetococcales bacterium]|nr:GIY-YIG nuclease family protein [Magnetococcales bacterium]
MASYVLMIEVSRASCPVVGARGAVDLVAGRYLYVGSARRAWRSRVARHLRSEKKVRWHIDYILAEPGIKVTKVWINPVDCECATAEDVLQLPEIFLPGQRLGSSDCRCLSHFIGVDGELVSLEGVLRRRGYETLAWRRVGGDVEILDEVG